MRVPVICVSGRRQCCDGNADTAGNDYKSDDDEQMMKCRKMNNLMIIKKILRSTYTRHNQLFTLFNTHDE